MMMICERKVLGAGERRRGLVGSPASILFTRATEGSFLPETILRRGRTTRTRPLSSPARPGDETRRDETSRGRCRMIPR